MAAAPMTVAVHSQRRLVGEALAWCLATQPGLSVVGHTQQWAQLVSLCRLRQPEVVIVDIATESDLDEARGQLGQLTTRWPTTFVVLLSEHLPPRASPDGVRWRIIPHTRGLGALVAALNDRSVARTDSMRPMIRQAKLTEREVEVLTMVSTGLTAPEIADRLEIGPRSVENHKRRIYAKLGANSQAAAVGAVAHLGILDGQNVLDSRPASPPELSRREDEILRLSARGSSVRQMANILGIAPKTVESQLSLLYRKLGVHNRAAALAVARAHGLIPETSDIP